MKELDQIVRLRRSDVRIDYYVMDAFWYSTNGGYREFRSPQWPNGPDRPMRSRCPRSRWSASGTAQQQREYARKTSRAEVAWKPGES
jgi:hypothetical protein